MKKQRSLRFCIGQTPFFENPAHPSPELLSTCRPVPKQKMIPYWKMTFRIDLRQFLKNQKKLTAFYTITPLDMVLQDHVRGQWNLRSTAFYTITPHHSTLKGGNQIWTPSQIANFYRRKVQFRFFHKKSTFYNVLQKSTYYINWWADESNIITSILWDKQIWSNHPCLNR